MYAPGVRVDHSLSHARVLRPCPDTTWGEVMVMMEIVMMYIVILIVIIVMMVIVKIVLMVDIDRCSDG